MPDFESLSGFFVRYLLIFLGILVSFLIPWALHVAFAQIGKAQSGGQSPTFWQRFKIRMWVALERYGPTAGAGAVIAFVLSIFLYMLGFAGIKIEKLGDIEMKAWPPPYWISLGIFWDVVWFKIVRSLKDTEA